MEAWTRNEAWSLEVEELDSQHEGIMLAWNGVLAAAPSLRKEPWKVLLGRMREHFGFEEGWMAESGFSRNHHHRHEHKLFLNEMEAVLADAEAGYPIDELTVKAAGGWLEGHVRGLDRDFARFLQEREAWDLRNGWELEEFEHRHLLVEA
jgi:hemerythrin-like metal-binding protein